MAFNNDQWQEALVSLGNTGAAPPDTSTSGTVTNNNDAVTITLPGGQSTALIQILGTFVGTLNFEASPDSGTTYYAVQASVVGGSTLATTATSVGAWRCNISGFTNFRVRLSPVTSGTASIGIRLSAGVHNIFINNASALGQAVMANSAPVVIASDQTNVPVNLARVLGATLSASNPNISESNIQNWIRNGQGFLADSGGPFTATNTNLTVCPLSLFNAANSGKNVYIFSLSVYCSNVTAIGNNGLRLTTTDPAGTTGFTGTPKSTNLKIGGSAPVASLSMTASSVSASITPTGTLLNVFGISASNLGVELLTNGSGILLPSGTANGIETILFVTTVGNYYGTVAKWIEY